MKNTEVLKNTAPSRNGRWEIGLVENKKEGLVLHVRVACSAAYYEKSAHREFIGQIY